MSESLNRGDIVKEKETNKTKETVEIEKKEQEKTKQPKKIKYWNIEKTTESMNAMISAIQASIIKERGLKESSLSKEEKRALRKEASEIFDKQEEERELVEKERIRKEILSIAKNRKILLTHKILKLIAREELSRLSKKRVKEEGVGIFELKERKEIKKKAMKKTEKENPDGNIYLTDELLELLVDEQFLETTYSIVEEPLSMNLDGIDLREFEEVKELLHKKIEENLELKIKKEEERKKSKKMETSKKKETRREKEERLGIEFIPFTDEEKEQLIKEHDKLIMSVATQYNNLRIDIEEKYDLCRLSFVRAMNYFNNNPALFSDNNQSSAKFTTLAVHFMNNAIISAYRKEKKTACSLQDIVGGSDDSEGISRQEDRVKDKTIPSIEAVLEKSFVSNVLNDAVKRLPKTEQIVVSCFYGINDFPKMNQKAIAKNLGMPVQEIAAIRAQGIKMLKKDLKQRGVLTPPKEF